MKHLTKLLVFFLLIGCSSEPFTLILLPDTQTYTRAYPEIFYAQTEWIAQQASGLAFVLHQGDITDDNVDKQWQVAQTAMSKLDGKVPYTFVPGNHDMGKVADTRNTDLFNTYFPYDKYSRAEHFGGAFEPGKMDNVWHTFKAGGKNWLILSLEFGPRNSVLKWAGEVIEQHPRHKVIINTHAYMYSDDTRMGKGDSWLPQGYGIGKTATGEDSVNNGEQIWEKLASKHKNVLLVLSGHVLHDGTGTLVSKGIHGNKVYQMLANYQHGVRGSEKGGNGFLRILSIDPKNNRIVIKTYSPYLDEYKTEPDQQFSFEDVDFKGTAKGEKQEDLTQYVNPLQGSNSKFAFSTGNTYPAVAVPWGMNFWTPQTGKMGSGWQYVYTDSTICGFKQTHQPSPWINDFGCFSIMPVTGEPGFGEANRASRFSHDNEKSLPHYYTVQLEKYGITAEVTPSSRGAIFNLTYPESNHSSFIIDCYNKGGYIKVIPEENKVIGYSRYYSPNNKATLPENFATYFVITSDKPFETTATWNDGEYHEEINEQTGKHVGASISFSTHKDEKVELKVASSFISIEQAQRNFDREIESYNFAGLKEKAGEEWNNLLSRTQVKGGSLDQKRTFYTALYRTMLFPHAIHEINKVSETIHYSPFTGTVEKGPMYTGNGFWDTFRAVHPYFTIMYPELSNDFIRGLANYYKEGGWLPEWFSPGYRDCMIGQHSVSVITDAYLKGISNYDIDILWEAIIKGANNAGPNATGRDGYQHYNTLGYIPYNMEHKESVSKTLEYAYNDYCIWQLGKALGKPDHEIAVYRKRAENYKNVFDRSINFVRPKDDKGNWESSDTWRPDTWGGSFTEGSSWHWTWSVFHDPAGLIELMGGEEHFINKLDSVFIAEPTFDWTQYGKEIHEMTEMVACNMGQYAHGNQPIQHAIYLYNYARVPYKTQYHVREVMDKLYYSGWNDGKGLCGDEDNGQTSAWYVFSAMGFYPVCPGSDEYIIGSPLFEEISLSLSGNRKFTVKAHNNSSQNVYIQSAKLNGQPLNRGYIKHDEIISGGMLEFNMGTEPNKEWGVASEDQPYSMSNDK